MSAQGDHVDCASVLLDRGALIDAGTRVRLRLVSYSLTQIYPSLSVCPSACFSTYTPILNKQGVALTGRNTTGPPSRAAL